MHIKSSVQKKGNEIIVKKGSKRVIFPLDQVQKIRELDVFKTMPLGLKAKLLYTPATDTIVLTNKISEASIKMPKSNFCKLLQSIGV